MHIWIVPNHQQQSFWPIPDYFLSSWYNSNLATGEDLEVIFESWKLIPKLKVSDNCELSFFISLSSSPRLFLLNFLLNLKALFHFSFPFLQWMTYSLSNVHSILLIRNNLYFSFRLPMYFHIVPTHFYLQITYPFIQNHLRHELHAR